MEIKLSIFNSSQAQRVIDVFTQVFSESENESEGRLIGELSGVYFLADL